MNGFREIKARNRESAQSAKVLHGTDLTQAKKRAHKQQSTLSAKSKMAAKKKTTSSRKKALLSTPNSEVEAYEYIRQRLRELGWNMKCPSLGSDGQVWTQNQCFNHPEIKAALGLSRPENIIKLSEDLLWVIEAKATRKQLDQAVDEAVNFYSKKINQSDGRMRVLLASGVAGNESSNYLIKTMICLNGNGRWRPVTINSQEATGLLSPAEVETLRRLGGSDIHEYAPPQWLFLQSAEKINEILHIGGINKNDRARTMAALLLAVLEHPPDVETSLTVLIDAINSRSKAVLTASGKPNFAPFIKILPPTNNTNHVKFKNALVKTLRELEDLNIRSAMNSSTDVLGQFYEVFLKYGNGAKEIGIVLTPRHITRFAVEAIGVSSQDVVLDPACGTGGFLVAAFDHVRSTCTPAQLEKFKKYNLFGVEQESYIAVLAIVNMIFRGDGKNNIAEGNSFTTHLASHAVRGHPSATFTDESPASGEEAITRVLMNPPFALSMSVEKEHRFVSQALKQMADGGILFSLLPMDSMFGTRDEKIWRKEELLKQNTLLSVISLPEELFYPAASKQVVAIIIKKGIPHPKDQSVFWARISRDGFIKVKSRRLHASEMIPPRTEPDEIPQVLPALRSFIANPQTSNFNVPMLYKTAPIDFDDPSLELLPEAYVDSVSYTEEAVHLAMDDLAREMACGLIRYRKEESVRLLDA